MKTVDWYAVYKAPDRGEIITGPFRNKEDAEKLKTEVNDITRWGGVFDRVEGKDIEIERYEYVDIPFAQAKEIFAKGKYRIKEEECGTNLQIYYKRRWRDVARTDKYDNVCTTQCCSRSIDEWKKFYIGKLHRAEYGARLQRTGTIAVIDSMTDG